MPNAKDADIPVSQRIILAGPTGSGKTCQIWTLPGKKFAYIFDPNSLGTLRGWDLEYETFYPDFDELDTMLRGFNKGSKSDRPQKVKEPTLYLRWAEDLNNRVDSGLLMNYDWVIFDSMTFIVRCIMARQLYINNRYGGIEDIADYRVVGSKIGEVFGNLAMSPANVFATAHINAYQDDKTKKIETELFLPGQSRKMMPLIFRNIWMTQVSEAEKGIKYEVRTRPEPRGFKDIRCDLPDLDIIEDVTIRSFGPESIRYGVGALLARQAKTKEQADGLHKSAAR